MGLLMANGEPLVDIRRDLASRSSERSSGRDGKLMLGFNAFFVGHLFMNTLGNVTPAAAETSSIHSHIQTPCWTWRGDTTRFCPTNLTHLLLKLTECDENIAQADEPAYISRTSIRTLSCFLNLKYCEKRFIGAFSVLALKTSEQQMFVGIIKLFSFDYSSSLQNRKLWLIQITSREELMALLIPSAGRKDFEVENDNSFSGGQRLGRPFSGHRAGYWTLNIKSAK